MVTLKLWVSNQFGDCDHTDAYLVDTGWTAPPGVRYSPERATLAGSPEAVWSAYRELAAAVAAGGHGVDGTEGEPVLTACPEGLEGIAARLARLESTEHQTWAAFAAEIPSLARLCGAAV